MIMTINPLRGRMKTVSILILLFSTIQVPGQNAQTEINQQVWKPFITAFNNRDTKSFMEVHSKDVARSPRDSKVVWNWSDYKAQIEKGQKSEKASQGKRELTLRFTERIANNNMAVDVGIYKTTYTDQNGSINPYYGRFHVVLRRENEQWKILVDTDSSEGNTISEKDFLAAAAME
jgi:ketosteroid isomerase-like protein